MSILEEPLYGDIEKGYYGTVSGLITNNALSTLVNISNGTLLDTSGTDITFHKFVHKGRILLIPNRPVRHTISWDSIQAQNLVKGRVIEIGGKKYLCRLMTGSRHYYTSNPSIAGGEWDDLFVNFHTSNGGPLSDADVYLSGVGRRSWCQEVHSGNINNRVVRGDTNNVNSFSSVISTDTTNWYSWRPVLELISDRPIGIGSTTLIYGDEQAGFYGEVNNLITGDQLRDITGVSQGVAMQTGDIDFLKFSHQSKVLYVAKQPIQHSISWDTLQIADVVFGKMITIGNYVYLLRLIQGANVSPAGSNGGINDEWENLMIPIHTSGSWGLYSNSDLGVASGNGRYTFCQEVGASTLTVRIVRGGTAVSNFTTNAGAGINDPLGWRPVLELVGEITFSLLNKILILDNEDNIISRDSEGWIQIGTEITPELFEEHGLENIDEITSQDWSELYDDFVEPFSLIVFQEGEEVIPFIQQTVQEKEFATLGKTYKLDLNENELEKIKGIIVA